MRAENIFPPQAVILDSPGQLELKIPRFSLFAVYCGGHLPVMQERHGKRHPMSSAWIYGCEGRQITLLLLLCVYQHLAGSGIVRHRNVRAWRSVGS